MISKKVTRRKTKDTQGQDSDEKVVSGPQADFDDILKEFELLNSEARSAFLCTIAHDLTVAIRSVVYDSPVTEEGLDRIKWINEALHHLTSCVNPHHRWSAHDEAQLIRGIIEDSIGHSFETWVRRAVAVAAAHTIDTKKSVVM